MVQHFFMLLLFFLFSEGYILTDGQLELQHQSVGAGEGQACVKYLRAEISCLGALVCFSSFFPGLVKPSLAANGCGRESPARGSPG